MSQLTLAAVVVVLVAEGAAPALPVGQGAADPEGAGAVVAVPVPVVPVPVTAVATTDGAVVAGAVAVAVAVAVPPWPWPLPCPWLAGTVYATGDAQLASAALFTFSPEWSTVTMTAPTATARATGIPTGPAKRASERLFRRPADRCLLGMQSTSMLLGICCVSRFQAETVELTRATYRQSLNRALCRLIAAVGDVQQKLLPRNNNTGECRRRP
jgi:hypothetical protein